MIRKARHNSTMKIAFSLLYVLSVGVTPLLAEDTPTSAPSPAPVSGGVTPPGKPGEKDGNEVSFLERSNLILAKLQENKRPTDPFGLLMDPANVQEAPDLAEQYEEVAEEAPALNNSSLKTALHTLPITGIYPQRGVVVIGARSFPIGGEFGMKLQELTIRLRFEGMKGTEVFFKDLETQEVASIPFNPLPTEFEPLTKSSGNSRGSGIVPMNELFIAN